MANWAEPTGPARARPENSPARGRSGPCQAPGRAWAGEAARGTSTGPARLVGRYVCGTFKRRSAPSSPSRRRSLSLRSLFCLAPPLSLSRRSSPAPPPLQRCSAPPGRRRSAAPPAAADRASSLLRSSLHPFLSDIDGRSRDGAARGSASPRRLDLSSLASVCAFADRFHRLPPSPPAAAVAGRPPPPRADRCTARARRAQRHGTARRRPRRAVPGPGCRHGGTARHGTAAQPCPGVPCPGVPVPAVLGPCPCRAARWPPILKSPNK